jgi:2-polyprenyl-6-methoxyphenol hydroxylase-like FAD-dependent oxidoreductase
VAAPNQGRAVVIGAGPAGLATAVALERAGWTASVCESAAGPVPGGSGLTLWPNAFAALAELGLAAAVRAAGSDSDGLEMRTDRGRVLQQLSRAELTTEFGGTGVALLRRDLVAALAEAYGSDRIGYGRRFLAAEQADPAGPVRVRFADGTEEPADLLVGADGARSLVRDGTLDLTRLRYLGFAVARGIAGHRHEPFPALMSMGAGSQFGMFPLPAGRTYWFASFRTEHGLPADPRTALTEFAGWHDPIPTVLAATPPDRLVLTDVYDSAPVRRWHRGRVTLAGDAAHPSAPTLGQGAGQAFEDAVALARCLGATPDVPRALAAYQQARASRANALTKQAHRMARLGNWRSPALCALRDRMIAAPSTEIQLRRLRGTFAAPARPAVERA